MISKMLRVFLLYVSMFLISSAYTLSPPANYTWPQNSKKLCFAGSFDLVLNVDYLKSDGAQASVKIPLNNDSYEAYKVSCSSPANIHELTISMLNGYTNILFEFTVNATNITSLTKVHGYIVLNDRQTYFKNYSDDVEGLHAFSLNESLFQAGRVNSYRCNTKTVIQGFNTDRNVTVTSIELENIRIQSFADDSMDFNQYGEETVCTTDVEKNSNLIPIIVGACLAVMVVIVLVAYLIGRRRSRNGYQSV